MKKEMKKLLSLFSKTYIKIIFDVEKEGKHSRNNKFE